MIEYNSTNSPSKIIIPISHPEDVLRYQRGVLGILGKIEVTTCTPALREDLKAVYDLLKHMLSTENIQQLTEAGKRRHGRGKNRT